MKNRFDVDKIRDYYGAEEVQCKKIVKRKMRERARNIKRTNKKHVSDYIGRIW